MTTDHGISIDEQIRFLDEQAETCLVHAREWEANPGAFDFKPMDGGPPFHVREREAAAMLFTVSNTLRAIRDRSRPAQD